VRLAKGWRWTWPGPYAPAAAGSVRRVTGR